MRDKIAAIAMVLLLPGLVLASLEFETTEQTFESGLFDKKLEAVFRFTNTGEQTVSISELRSSCGCTVPTLEKKTYAPGESGEIKALFTFGGRSGPQHKTVYLKTDDPDNPDIRLAFSTTIPEWCTVSPRLLRWSETEDAKPLEVSLTVSDPDRISVTLKEHELEYFSVKPVDSSPGVVVYVVTPKAMDTRVTEKLIFTVTARDGDTVEKRDTVMYCLIR